MMKRKISALMFTATACLLVIWGSARPGMAQPALERLEQSIRNRSDAGTSAVNPAPTPAAAQPAAAESIPPPPAVRGEGGAEEKRGYLGAVVDDKNDRGRGVRVLEVRADGPSARAGLKAGDLITSVAQMRVRQMSDMADVLALFPPGDVVVLNVLRDEKPQQIKVTLGRQPAAKALAVEPPGPILEPPPAPVFPSPAAAVTPNPPTASPTADQSARIDELQRRVERLERRVEELEKALAAALKNK